MNTATSPQLSPHFWLHDFVADLIPSPRQIANLTRLCLAVLEPLLVHAGSLRIVNGLARHTAGDAADITKAKIGRMDGPRDLWDPFHACARIDSVHHAILRLNAAGNPIGLFVQCTPLPSDLPPAGSRGLFLQRGEGAALECFTRQR